MASDGNVNDIEPLVVVTLHSGTRSASTEGLQLVLYAREGEQTHSGRAMSPVIARVHHVWPRPFRPVHLVVCFVVAGSVTGVVWGGVRGSTYLSTLPVAVVEGGALFGAPAAALGLLVAGVWQLVRRRRPATP